MSAIRLCAPIGLRFLAIPQVLLFVCLLLVIAVAGCQKKEEQPQIRVESPESVCGKEILGSIRAEAKVIQGGDQLQLVTLYDNGQKAFLNFTLDSVDAPENDQPFGDHASRKLSDLVMQKPLIVHGTELDKNDYPVRGFIMVGDINVNTEMVRRGFAWHDVAASDDSELAKLEKEARENGTGLWGVGDPIAPWEWRQRPKEDQ